MQLVNGEGATIEGTVNAMVVGAASVMVGQLIDKAANAIASSTSKASTDSIFWTGIGDDGTTAMNYARQHGGTTLEMTEVGKSLPGWTKETKSLWDEASKGFAQNAKGDVKVLVGQYGINPNSTFSRIELPELMQNADVKNIIYINIE